MTAARPSSALINGQEWKITYKGRKAWKKGGHDPACSGETYAATHSIDILVWNIDEANVREVLQHELMHACLAASGGTYIPRFLDVENAEEALISTMSGTFIAVMQRNPEIRAYLYGG